MPPVLMRSPEGDTVQIPEEEVAFHTRRGYAIESAEAGASRVASQAREEYYTTPGAKAVTGLAGFGRTVSGGLTDVLADAAGIGEDFAALRKYNPGISAGSEVLGAVSGVGAAGLATRAGAAVARTAEGAGTVTRIARAGAGAATEGALLGTGSGVSELALSKDPISLEGAISTIGSAGLFGGAVGGAAGLLTKGAAIGLGKARDKLDDIAARGTAEVDDIAKIALRDEVAAFRKEIKQSKVWLATKDSGVTGLRTVGKRTLKADKALDNLLDDPKALIDNPKAALRHLRVQEAALQEVAEKTDEIRAALTAQNSTNRIAALDKVAPTLERNRSLQSKIEQIIAKPDPAVGGGFGTNMLGGQAFGVAAGAVGAVPVIGPMLAPFAGAAASKLVTEGLGKMAAKSAARASKAIGTFLDVANKAPPIAPVLASKVLSTVRYAPGSKQAPIKETKKGSPAPRLAKAFKARADEIKSQTMYDPSGIPVMRPEARERLAQRFDGLRGEDPIAADKLETLAAKRLTFLASKLPRKPDVAGLGTGPDRWQPSDMLMRAAARYMIAVEDPIGVVERLATGQITPEDAEAMREVYPEMYADIRQQIITQLPTLRATLPYHRRLALSIFSGAPVDPAMHPRIIKVLQASFSDEPGTEGGTQSPTPQPQFGSVRNQEATPSELRQGATA